LTARGSWGHTPFANTAFIILNVCIVCIVCALLYLKDRAINTVVIIAPDIFSHTVHTYTIYVVIVMFKGNCIFIMLCVWQSVILLYALGRTEQRN